LLDKKNNFEKMALSGTIAIVTGSAGGLGRGFAEAILSVRTFILENC